MSVLDGTSGHSEVLETAVRAAVGEVDHAPGCDVFRVDADPFGEPRHCDCGFALWDAKRRGVYNWTPPEAHRSCLGCGASGDSGPTYCSTHGDWLCERCVNAIREPFGDPKKETP